MEQKKSEVAQICDSLNVIFRSIDTYGKLLNSNIQSIRAAPVCFVDRIPSYYEFESPIFTKSDECVMIPNLYQDTHGCIIFPLYEKKMFSEIVHSYELIAIQHDPDEPILEKSFENIPDLYSECINMWVNNFKASAKYLNRF